MKKLLIALSCLLMTTPTYAQNSTQVDTKSINCSALDLTKYDQQELANIRNFCTKDKGVFESTVTPDKVREWASLGKEFSTAVTETAKGLGVAVNEFVYTPVGMMIAFYFLWSKIGGIIIGIPILIAIWVLYFKIVNLRRIPFETYEYIPTFFGLYNRKVVKKTEMDAGDADNLMFVMCMTAIPTIFLSCLTIGVLIL